MRFRVLEGVEGTLHPRCIIRAALFSMRLDRCPSSTFLSRANYPISIRLRVCAKGRLDRKMLERVTGRSAISINLIEGVARIMVPSSINGDVSWIALRYDSA